MSAGDDNVFARWSRRKQAVRHSETAATDEDKPAAVVAKAEIDAGTVDHELAATEPEADELPEPLPRLEDLTAESDLSAFLRKGVPNALRSAAMRKMWSLDPAIRDYIGPSEYAWDFNQPGSMAGFGPLDDAGEAVAEFLSTMSGGARAGFAKAIAASESSLALPQEAAAASPEQEAIASPDGLADAALPEALPEPPHVPTNLQSHSLDHVAAAAEPPQAARVTESSQFPVRPSHGRALPR